MSLKQNIPLTDAFTDQYINVPGNWLCLETTSDGYIEVKFDDTSYGITKLNPGDTYNIPFQRFWITNQGQAGREANIIIGMGDDKPPLSSGSVQQGVFPQIGTGYFRSEGLQGAGSILLPIFTAAQNQYGCVIHSYTLTLYNNTINSVSVKILDDSAFNGLFLLGSLSIGNNFQHIQNEAIKPGVKLDFYISVLAGGACTYTATMRYTLL